MCSPHISFSSSQKGPCKAVVCWEMVTNQLSEETTNACMCGCRFAINFTYKRGRKRNSQIIMKHNALHYELYIVTGFSKNAFVDFYSQQICSQPMIVTDQPCSTDMNVYININVDVNDNANVKQHLCMWELQLDTSDNSFQMMEGFSFRAIHNVMVTDTIFNLHY